MRTVSGLDLSDPGQREQAVLAVLGHKKVAVESLNPEAKTVVYKCLDCGARVPLERS